MKLSQVAGALYLLLPFASARAVSDLCVTVTTLPLITVTKCPGGYENEYTRSYSDFVSGGIATKGYTITQTCTSINCQPPPVETAPPPGFTHAVIQCNECNDSQTQVATLTFPIESLGAYSASGYVVRPVESGQGQSGQGQPGEGPQTMSGGNLPSATGMGHEDPSPTPLSDPSSLPDNGPNPSSIHNLPEGETGTGSAGDAGESDSAENPTIVNGAGISKGNAFGCITASLLALVWSQLL